MAHTGLTFVFEKVEYAANLTARVSTVGFDLESGNRLDLLRVGQLERHHAECKPVGEEAVKNRRLCMAVSRLVTWNNVASGDVSHSESSYEPATVRNQAAHLG